MLDWTPAYIAIHVEILKTLTFYIFNMDTAAIAEDTLNDFSIHGFFWES